MLSIANLEMPVRCFGTVASADRVWERLSRTFDSVAARAAVIGALILSIVAAVTARGSMNQCVAHGMAEAAMTALMVSYIILPPRRAEFARLRRVLRGAEDGFGTFDAMIAAGVVVVLVAGAGVVFSSQTHVAATITTPDSLRDQVTVIDTDVNAVQAYDPTVQPKISSSGLALWTATLANGTDVATISASPAQNGVMTVAKLGNQAASSLVPLPAAKPTPR